jgi:hypothetical protein
MSEAPTELPRSSSQACAPDPADQTNIAVEPRKVVPGVGAIIEALTAVCADAIVASVSTNKEMGCRMRVKMGR